MIRSGACHSSLVLVVPGTVVLLVHHESFRSVPSTTRDSSGDGWWISYRAPQWGRAADRAPERTGQPLGGLLHPLYRTDRLNLDAGAAGLRGRTRSAGPDAAQDHGVDRLDRLPVASNPSELARHPGGHLPATPTRMHAQTAPPTARPLGPPLRAGPPSVHLSQALPVG